MPPEPAGTSLDFVVRRDDLRTCRFVETPLPALKPGQALLKVEKFAFTANNVTYAVYGGAMRYWDFFPAADGWGRIPVWGFGEVLASRHEGVAPAERVYGYFPISTHLAIEPMRATETAFGDGAAHRAPMAPVYNQYLRVAKDRGHDPGREGEQALLRPLFLTSFLIDDFLAENDFFGARAVAVSSASSKTSLGLAFLLSRSRRPRVEAIGLTSAPNVAFVERTGYYDRVVRYDAIAELPRSEPTVWVDVAGDGNVRSAIHRHFGDRLRHSCLVGGTHWEERAAPQDLPGARPTFFFAPDRVRKRSQDWGPGGVESRFADAWRALLPSVDGWLRIRDGRGRSAVQAVYLALLDGRARPEDGHVLSLWE